jgi:hypothetical protein
MVSIRQCFHLVLAALPRSFGAHWCWLTDARIALHGTCRSLTDPNAVANWFILLNFGSADVSADLKRMFRHCSDEDVAEVRRIIVSKRQNMAIWAKRFITNELTSKDPAFECPVFLRKSHTADQSASYLRFDELVDSVFGKVWSCLCCVRSRHAFIADHSIMHDRMLKRPRLMQGTLRTSTQTLWIVGSQRCVPAYLCYLFASLHLAQSLTTFKISRHRHI